MRFRLHEDKLHVHRCDEHPQGCEYFSDHALSWMLGNRDSAKAQLVAFRVSVVSRISALTLILASIDQALHRLSELHA